jgi:hypothetical protein
LCRSEGFLLQAAVRAFLGLEGDPSRHECRENWERSSFPGPSRRTRGLTPALAGAPHILRGRVVGNLGTGRHLNGNVSEYARTRPVFLLSRESNAGLRPGLTHNKAEISLPLSSTTTFISRRGPNCKRNGWRASPFFFRQLRQVETPLRSPTSEGRMPMLMRTLVPPKSLNSRVASSYGSMTIATQFGNEYHHRPTRNRGPPAASH